MIKLNQKLQKVERLLDPRYHILVGSLQDVKVPTSLKPQILIYLELSEKLS